MRVQVNDRSSYETISGISLERLTRRRSQPTRKQRRRAPTSAVLIQAARKDVSGLILHNATISDRVL